ncbi:MAG: NUDIX hydrolase [Lachnospiraceae bacterium]|nr:NUDIX hydrolase [Lachnospiraceae bacterium]
MIKDFELIERKTVEKTRVFEYCKDTLKLPDGRITVYETLIHKGAAAVVPVLDDGRILLVRQYRHAINRVALEIPAGGRNSTDEPFIEAAKRELEEETGYRSDDLEHLISVVTAIAYCDEVIEVFVAKNLVPSSQNLDPDEFIEVEAFEPEMLSKMIYEGKIQDSKTIAAIMSYLNTYRS